MNLIDMLFEADDAPGLRLRVAELEATIAQRDARIAELSQALQVAQESARFYYGLATDKPLKMMAEDEWGR